MSAPETATTKKVAYQPFECLVCHSRFTRHENLKRHAALHSTSPEETSLPCGLCSSTFSRQDLRRRHMKRKHPEVLDDFNARAISEGSVTPTKRSRPEDLTDDDQTISLDDLYSGGRIAGRELRWTTDTDLIESNQEFIQPQVRISTGSRFETTTSDPNGGLDVSPTHTRSGPQYNDPLLDNMPNIGSRNALGSAVTSHQDFGGPLHQTSTTNTFSSNFSHSSYMLSPTASDVTEGSSTGPSPNTIRFRDDWFPSPVQVTRGLELYFHHISHLIPIMHPQTYDEVSTLPVLLLSILSLAYQYGDDPTREEEQGSGKALALHCFHRARILLRLSEDNTEDPEYALALVQAYLLMEICAMMYLCGKSSAYALKAHPKMISLSRSGAVLHPKTSSSSTTNNLEDLWRAFIKAESCKRTAYAIHQFDAMLYQFLSIPRSLSHLEIKHDLPCSSETWAATSAAEWAHLQLTAGQSSGSMSYVDTVRLFLSPQPKLESLPAFDPYGAINIAQFLISSAREISGWSAMTGRVSMERFEPLRSSLEALRPFIRVQAGSAKSVYATASAATWEIAMIELQMWSPSHTGGIVGESIDRVLEEWTSSCLGPWSETLFNASKAIQPHVDWYLQYLDTTTNVDFEPPWIALYAYKAYLIAWQLLRGGMSDAMQVVGVSDGSCQDAISWAKSVFGRRRNGDIGRLIVTSLDVMANQDDV